MRIFQALPRGVEGGAGRLLFATNAGLFLNSKLKPVGLYVERGRELVHVNIKSGRGNFHMKPNGMLYYIGRQCSRRGDAGISKAATSGRPSNAIWADAGDEWALASPFQPGQHVAQIAQRCWRTCGWQSHIRHLSGSSVI